MGIGVPDSMITAIAINNKLTLVTDNTKGFQRMK
jgi:predicted nucleic acid-binding protein